MAFRATAQPLPPSFLIEAEDFQFSGEWLKESDSTASGHRILRTPGAAFDALTVISLPQAASYRVWVRSRDYLEYPGKRRFKLAIDGILFEPEFGAHGVAGWKWERAGERELTAGDHVVALHDSAKFYGRADAIMLTPTDVDPNTLASPSKSATRLKPKPVAAEPAAEFAPVPETKPGESEECARLENEHLRLRFLKSSDTAGKPQIRRETELKTGDAWFPMAVEPGGERLFVLSAGKVDIRTSSMLPSWTSEPARAPIYHFTVGTTRYQAVAGRSNPFFAAPAQPILARSARQVSAHVVKIAYETASGWFMEGQWTLQPGARDWEVSLAVQAPAEGYYSFGFSPFQGWNKETVSGVLLPPLFQFQRLPESPVMVPSNSTPQALALAQIERSGHPISLAVVASPERLPFVWANAQNAVYGFSLLNAENAVQPTIFTPVLGLEGSQMHAGEHKTVSWRVLAFPGDWKGALEYASNEIFKVTDYRKPCQASLSNAALNMIDLIKTDDASGWNAERKGFWNIETTNVASQASPLTLLSAAILTCDEALYQKRALPTIEYSLSRPQAHFGMEVPTTHAAYINEEGTRIKVPSEFYGTAYWQGLHDLLGRRNPWLPGIAMPDGKVRHRTGYSTVPRWSEMLGAYRLSPDPALLNAIRAEADQFLASEVYGKKTRDLGLEPFYNVSFYPYWWDLLDLYDLTRSKSYLDAAEQSAFYTLAGLWSHPRVPDGDTVIHPGGDYAGEPHLWWKGDQPFRLGMPRQANATPERKVPAWLVAQVGLGLEQPCTYFASGKAGMRNIMMSAWAPNLLRLYRHTGREIFRTYARNSVISRFTNYPGYYISGYTDLELDPEYPYRGPDVTSIYYHHIPPHLAFTIDFLVTEAEERSQGQITFPWVKQQGYVWFSNRLYGHAPGSVFGEASARLWLDRKAVRVKTPAVNYLLARSKDHVWIILMNEAAEETLTPIALDPTALEIGGDSFTLLRPDGSKATSQIDRALSISIPAKGLVALSFEANPPETSPIPPLKGGRTSLPLPGEWGTLEAFRIRSPFGKDSLFAVLTGRPNGSVRATLKMEGIPAIDKKAYPYEFSVYPWPMDRDMTFSLELQNPDGAVLQTSLLNLPGTH